MNRADPAKYTNAHFRLKSSSSSSHPSNNPKGFLFNSLCRFHHLRGSNSRNSHKAILGKRLGKVPLHCRINSSRRLLCRHASRLHLHLKSNSRKGLTLRYHHPRECNNSSNSEAISNNGLVKISLHLRANSRTLLHSRRLSRFLLHLFHNRNNMLNINSFFKRLKEGHPRQSNISQLSSNPLFNQVLFRIEDFEATIRPLQSKHKSGLNRFSKLPCNNLPCNQILPKLEKLNLNHETSALPRCLSSHHQDPKAIRFRHLSK